MCSAPEVLKQPKKIQEGTKAMDVYSFGIMMWELFFETVPFDGDLAECIKYVTVDNGRPKIRVQKDADFEDEETLKSVT